MTPEEIRNGPSRKLRIVSDGSYYNSHVIDVLSGERIRGIKKIELTISGGRVTSAVLHLRSIELDITAQVSTMTDQELVPERTIVEIETQFEVLQLPNDIVASQRDPQVYYNREETHDHPRD